MSTMIGHHVTIIGDGAVGAISAIEALRSILGDPGGTDAASYRNAGWLIVAFGDSEHLEKGAGLSDRTARAPSRSAGPKALHPLIRYLLAGRSEVRVEKTTVHCLIS
nr:hypothetical protein [Bradyrhizobium diazoefficiens]